MPQVDLNVLAEVIEEYARAPHGRKQTVLAERLSLLGISHGTFYRYRARWGRRDYDRKTPTTRGQVKEPERLKWTEEIMRLKHSGVRSLTTADAISLAVQWGRIPKEAAAVPDGTYNRLARLMRFNKEPRRGVRFQAPYFNYLHQVDASGSEYFYPHHLDGGEWILKMRNRPMKNKPTPEGRRKLWYWGMAEDFSGCRIARTVVAAGESALDGIAFLQYAWGNDAAHAPVRGIPLILYMDNGVLARHHGVQRFTADCMVTIRTHEPERAQATGKVETGWKDFWKRFEAPFLRLPDWRTREISQKELQQELAWFVRGSNQRRHRQLPCSKEEAWLASVRSRGGLVDIDPGAWDTVFRDFRRTLDDAGVFDFRGAAFQVQEIHACPVIVYQQMKSSAGGDACATVLLVEDRRDGRRYHARPFVIPEASDWKTTAHTPLENLLKDDPWKGQRPALPTWAPGSELGAALASNVLVLPPRAAEVRESGFEVPPRQSPVVKGGASIEDLAAGVEVIRSAGGDACATEEQLFGSTLEKYEYLLFKRARGEVLTQEEEGFMDYFRAEHQGFMQTCGADLERRAQLRAVE